MYRELSKEWIPFSVRVFETVDYLNVKLNNRWWYRPCYVGMLRYGNSIVQKPA